MAKATEKIFLIKTYNNELLFKSASEKSHVIHQDTGEDGIFMGNPKIKLSQFIDKKRVVSNIYNIYHADGDNLFRSINQNRWIVIRQAEKDLIDRVKREQGLK